MSDPDLEGFVRMEGVKGKRYLAIKGELMAYYNTYNVSSNPFQDLTEDVIPSYMHFHSQLLRTTKQVVQSTLFK